MKRKMLMGLVILMGLIQAEAGFGISDVPKSNPAYSSVKRSIDSGYMSLFNGEKFYPNRRISRLEMAIIIDRLQRKAANSELEITKEEVAELKLLVRSLKDYLAKQDTSSSKFVDRVSEVESEQKEINYDVTKLSENIETIKKDGVGKGSIKKEDRRFIFVGVVLGLVALLAG